MYITTLQRSEFFCKNWTVTDAVIKDDMRRVYHCHILAWRRYKRACAVDIPLLASSLSVLFQNLLKPLFSLFMKPVTKKIVWGVAVIAALGVVGS